MAITLSGENTYTLFAAGRLREIACAWISDGDGDASVALSALTGEDTLVGHLVGAKALFGSPAPSADYDVYIQDPDGTDLLGAGLVDCPADANKLAMLSVPVPIFHDLTVTVEAAGDTKKGIVKILISD